MGFLKKHREPWMQHSGLGANVNAVGKSIHRDVHEETVNPLAEDYLTNLEGYICTGAQAKWEEVRRTDCELEKMS